MRTRVCVRVQYKISVLLSIIHYMYITCVHAVYLFTCNIKAALVCLHAHIIVQHTYTMQLSALALLHKILIYTVLQRAILTQSIEWLTYRLINLLIAWLIGLLIDRLINLLIDWLINLLIDWLIDLLIDWLINTLQYFQHKASCLFTVCLPVLLFVTLCISLSLSLLSLSLLFLSLCVCVWTTDQVSLFIFVHLFLYLFFPYNPVCSSPFVVFDPFTV